MNELKIKLVFWGIMTIVTASGGIFYVIKYDMDVVFIMLILACALMFNITQTLKTILRTGKLKGCNRE
ncbi:hypothetical protein SJ093_18235 [Citrobacter freundii]|uniref:hypothetical protein n=1 Tax=Citrobacter freundii TaxID=546 RepID=UPI000FD9A560|nr:hypothetical protein [Citrobacter freundii]HED4020352.1 hypothetical protein [Escherichia coli]MCT4736237.1 hypothetical protein [Citrobacter freundii]MDT7068128.1 hypothetical protein [Citrobacter freundii]MDT7083172.1 hypothetical protein [Citrobacter freundii]MDT7137459.1 hypothetical protein [Citrobacter freundii]